jgi:hypothetical protein
LGPGWRHGSEASGHEADRVLSSAYLDTTTRLVSQQKKKQINYQSFWYVCSTRIPLYRLVIVLLALFGPTAFLSTLADVVVNNLAIVVIIIKGIFVVNLWLEIVADD